MADGAKEQLIVKQRSWVLHLGATLGLLILGCGAEKPAKIVRVPQEGPQERRHDYSAAWIYTVGDVDSPGPQGCNKAFVLLNGETNCKGQACRHARDMARDYKSTCRKIDSASNVSHVAELSRIYDARVAEPSVACTQKAADWAAHGCGTNGACESSVQRWATRCANVIQSPLTLQILERVIENSLADPRRIKIDAHGCEDFAKDLRQVEDCTKPFDCEDALPKVEQYLLRCAEGKRKVVPLRDAFSIARITLGAQKEFKPIALANQKVLLDSLPGMLLLSDNSGLVYKVCDEPVSDLKAYLEASQKCAKGEVILLRAVSRIGGPELDIARAHHESDEVYSTAFPSLSVKGEASEREKLALERLNQALAASGNSNLATGFAPINRAYAALPVALRRSDQVRQLFAERGDQLVALFREIAEAKIRVIRGRTTDVELVAFARRAFKLPFADMTAEGVVQLGATCDCSELALGEEMKAAHAAYVAQFSTLEKRVEKTKLKGTEGFSELLDVAKQQGKRCSTAKQQVAEVVTAFDICLGGDKSCSQEELKTLWAQLEVARSQWRAARAREIVFRVSAGSDDRSSAACSAL